MAVLYDVTKVHLNVDLGDGNGFNEVTDLAPDGFGMTPGSENTLIPALKGTAGFSIDPSDTADITITLLSSSEWNEKFSTYRANKMQIEISSDDEALTGWKTITIANAMVQKRPEWSTNEKEQPMVEWTFIGYAITPVYS